MNVEITIMGIASNTGPAKVKVLTTSLASLPQKIQVLEAALEKLKSKLPQEAPVENTPEEPSKKTKTTKKKEEVSKEE